MTTAALAAERSAGRTGHPRMPGGTSARPHGLRIVAGLPALAPVRRRGRADHPIAWPRPSPPCAAFRHFH